MANLGTFTILAAFVIASAAFAASIAGAKRGKQSLVDGGIGLFHVVTALMLLASAIIVHAFVTGDYAIKYIQRNSNDAQPLFYKLTSYWGGLDGSIMFWVTLLAAFGSIAVQINRERQRLLIPWVVATIATVEMFFLFLMVVHNNPFDTFLATAPTAGRGLDPLLQNFYMAIHPPMLYLGFVGMTIPFAFGMAALVTGQLDESWFRNVRGWTMMAWLFLTVGVTLGGLWAYEELGWGGYWMWDPVENASLLPWFTGTAFLHSVMVQERRGMLKVWNISLVIVTFFLTIFATFMTRSGIVQSVHSFVVNNWILLFSAFFVLFAAMFPTLSEALRGERKTVGPDFFNKWMTPIGLMLLLLTGVGPLLAWRKSTVFNLRDQFLWPTVSAVVIGVGAAVLKMPFWPTGLCFALCAFVAATIVQEFVRGASVRHRATGIDMFSALVGLFARSRRRYGGYVIHLGVVLVFIGFAGNGFSREEEVRLSPGQQVELYPYVVHYKALTVTDDGQKQMVTASLDATRKGKPFASLYPARWYFRGHEDNPTTEVALKRTMADDLYLVLANFDTATQEAHIAVHIKPLVNWIWLGIGILVIGTVIALLPERTFSFATSKVPSSAVTTSLVLLLMLGAGGALLHAQHVDAEGTVIIVPKSPLEKDLQRSIICMCGTCGRKRVGECTCSMAADMRKEIAGLVKEGKTRDEVLQYFVTKYGSEEPLSQPIDKGFNRIAWALPYATGVAGVFLLGFAAFRLSRRTATAAPAAAPAGNAELERRLDDELRDLD